MQSVRALRPTTFAKLIRHVGLEDAGELVALATNAQLVSAFDEDLFVSAGPGQHEVFDEARFATWIEVLMEAGDALAAKRMAKLSEDFVVHGVNALAVVLDYDALMLRFAQGGESARVADKALESALCEKLDGYFLVSRQHRAWDALLGLILALDRDHRAFLERVLKRVLDRCAALCSGYVDELDELINALTLAESLTEDVEATREARRASGGYVEPRAARAFLTLARKEAPSTSRDPLTAAYFRELDPLKPSAATLADEGAEASLLEPLERIWAAELSSLTPHEAPPEGIHAAAPIFEALQRLCAANPTRYEARIAELAYLANALVAGAALDGRRMRHAEASEVALATVSLDVALESACAEAMCAQHRSRTVLPTIAISLHAAPLVEPHPQRAGTARGDVDLVGRHARLEAAGDPIGASSVALLPGRGDHPQVCRVE